MITELVIDRKTWMRGENVGFVTQLLNPGKKGADGEQYMCCLGQLCLAMGMKEKDISGIPGPGVIDQGAQGFDWWDNVKKRDFAYKAMDTNGSRDLSDSEREAKLIPLFQDVGIALSFAED